MSMTERVALYAGGVWFYLPPFFLKADPRKKSETRQYKIAKAGTILKARHTGFEIDIEGTWRESSRESGRLFRQSLEDFFYSSGTMRLVDVQLWDEESGTIKGCYRDCQLSGDVEFDRPVGRTARIGNYKFTLLTKAATRYATVTGGINAPEGPYEEYIYGGADAAAAVRGYDDMNVAFEAGIAEVTVAGNVAMFQRVMIPCSDRPCRVTGLMQIGCAGLYGTTGATVARVSDTDYASAGNYLECSAAYSAAQSAKATGSIYLAAGASLYLYLTGTGGHNIPVFQINIEVL